MEVHVLSRITEFGGDLGSLPNPNFLSRIFTSFSPSHDFWRWGALVIALLVTFSGVINRVKILIILIRRRKPTLILQSLPGGEHGGFVSQSLVSPLLLTSESEDENQGGWEQEDQSDFTVKGSGRVSDEFDGRRCSGLWQRHSGGDSFSWFCFGLERSVVRQWDDVKLKCELEGLSGSVISLYDQNGEAEICSIVSGGAPLQATTLLSPGRIVVGAGDDGLGNVSLKLWDTRGRSRTPVVAAEWNSSSGKIVDVYSENVEKVYLRDNGAAGIMLGDVRKVRSASKSRRQAVVRAGGSRETDAVYNFVREIGC